MTRYEANKQILTILEQAIEQWPDWRFQQLLQNLGISSRYGVDLWYEESTETLKNMKQNPIANYLKIQLPKNL